MTACLALCASCASVATQEDAPASPPANAEKKKKDDDGSERRALERKLKIAELQRDQTLMEHANADAKTKLSVDLAREELGMAQAKLDQFREVDMPNSVAKSELSLQRAKDSTQEAAEELEQLEIMYRDQDLEDLTSEFVINRGKRRAERAQRSLAIQESEFASLKNHSMPRELRTRELDVIKKTDALRAAEADAEASALKQQIAILKIEGEITDLREKLAKLDEKDDE